MAVAGSCLDGKMVGMEKEVERVNVMASQYGKGDASGTGHQKPSLIHSISVARHAICIGQIFCMLTTFMNPPIPKIWVGYRSVTRDEPRWKIVPVI